MCRQEDQEACGCEKNSADGDGYFPYAKKYRGGGGSASEKSSEKEHRRQGKGVAAPVGGVMFALAAAGASTMPALVGVVSRYSGSLRIGLLVPLAGCAVMLVVIALLRPNFRR